MASEGSKFLVAVFPDYPELCDEANLKRTIQSERGKEIYLWILSRFLELGRAVDVFKFFTLDEIRKNIALIRLSPRAREKWERIIEVYSENK